MAEPLTIVQWETAAYYTFEAEIEGRALRPGEPKPVFTELVVGMARLGSSAGTSRVQWKTFDMSAKAKHNYVEVKPQWIEFAPGEIHKEVVLRIVPADSFDGVLEFGLHIITETAEGTRVGKYLHTSTVKIIDQSAFPTEALRDWVEGGRKAAVMAITPQTLVYEFLKMSWSLGPTRRGTIKAMAAHQYKNVVAVANVFILLGVTNVLTDPEGTELLGFSSRGLLFVLAMLWCASLARR